MAYGSYGLRASKLNRIREAQREEIPNRGKKSKGIGETGEGVTWNRVGKDCPVRVRGMVLAGNHLLVAGTVGERSDDPEKWLAALRNQGSAELWRINAEDGEVIRTLHLTAAPVFDGLIAAGGRVFISQEDGTVVCLDHWNEE